MIPTSMSRRGFSRLAAAALGGVLGGAVAMNLAGCSNQPGGDTGKPVAGSSHMGEGERSAKDANACAGLNGCKGQGADAKNSCAGQGSCASTAMRHECKGHNECKGQGGGEHAGENACKGQGGCAVPLTGDAWKMAREKFEARMKAAGKEVGPAPKKS